MGCFTDLPSIIGPTALSVNHMNLWMGVWAEKVYFTIETVAFVCKWNFHLRAAKPESGLNTISTEILLKKPNTTKFDCGIPHTFMKYTQYIFVFFCALVVLSCQDSNRKVPFSIPGGMQELTGQWELKEFTYPNVEQRYTVGGSNGSIHYKTVTFASDDRFNTYTDSQIVYGSKYIYMVHNDTIDVKSGSIENGVRLNLKQFKFGFNETQDELKLVNLVTGVTEYYRRKL